MEKSSVNLPSPLVSHLRSAFSLLSDEEFFTRVDECLKFLFLTSKYGGGFIPVNKEVDDVWHQLILQTSEYESLCQRLPGKRFLHHRSGGLDHYSEQNGKRESVQKLISWIPLYYTHFGKFKEEVAHLWTPVSFCLNVLEMPLDTINHVAEIEAAKLIGMEKWDHHQLPF